MVTSCCVVGCRKSLRRKRTDDSDEEKKFFRFPKVNARLKEKCQRLQQQRRERWVAILKRKNITEKEVDALRICNRHFISGKPCHLEDELNPDWVPKCNMGYEIPKSSIESAVVRYARTTEREKRKRVTATAARIDDVHSHADDASTQPDIDDTPSSIIAEKEAQLHKQSEIIREQNEKIREQDEKIRALELRIAKLSLKEEAFKNEDEKMLHFTGLQSTELFLYILQHMKSALNSVKVKHLTNFQKLMLTLMKLKMNSSFQMLGYRFEIRGEEASTCFKHVIILLEYAFSALVHWPDRESLRTAMPEVFQEAFGNSVAVVIDCFEITTEKPSNMKARSQSFSQYKHKYTAKYLIGITPHGNISFISEGYGGRASDNFVTQDSGLLDNLVFGDVVLADRGFTIKEVVSMQYAELLTPNFLERKKQLPPAAIEKTRKIASVRIHVERIIGLTRSKYRILNGPIPINFLKLKYGDRCFLDYVVRVCCIFVNLCDSIVPMHKAKHVNDNVAVALNPELFTENFDICT